MSIFDNITRFFIGKTAEEQVEMRTKLIELYANRSFERGMERLVKALEEDEDTSDESDSDTTPIQD